MVKNFLIFQKINNRSNKACFKKSNIKKAAATCNLACNKINDKIIIVLNKSSKKLHSKKLQNNEANDETEVPKERYISKKKRQQMIDELWLV